MRFQCTPSSAIVPTRCAVDPDSDRESNKEYLRALTEFLILGQDRAKPVTNSMGTRP